LSQARSKRWHDDEVRLTLSRLSKAKHLDFRWLESEEIQVIRVTLEKLYSAEQMSTTEIAREIGRSTTFVWSLCRRLGIPLRTPDEGKALSAPGRVRTLRRPFSGSLIDRCYMLGFAEGDLDVRRASTNAILVSSTTTHPSFSACFRELFEQYGPVYHYPVYEKVRGYRWKVAARLDNSFSFLLPSSRKRYPDVTAQPNLFYSWLAGILDADGSVSIVRSGEYVKLSLIFSNEDLRLLSHIKSGLATAGYYPTGPYMRAAKGHVTRGWYIRYNSEMWSLHLQRAEEVREVLGLLPLRHKEKILRKEIALSLLPGTRWMDAESRIRSLRDRIERDVVEYVANAEIAYKKRGLGQANESPSPVARQLRTS